MNFNVLEAVIDELDGEDPAQLADALSVLTLQRLEARLGIIVTRATTWWGEPRSWWEGEDGYRHREYPPYVPPPPPPRFAMEKALKAMVKAELRSAGFTGSFPHLRKISVDRIDLISFQFHPASDSFVVVAACCGPEGLTVDGAEPIPPDKVTTHHVEQPRARLGSPTFPVGDHWFVFGPRSKDSGDGGEAADYDAIAREISGLIKSQAQEFWEAFGQ